MMVKREHFQKLALWGLLSIGGAGGVVANIGGAAMAERVVTLEVQTKGLEKQLEKMDKKLDTLIERGR